MYNNLIKLLYRNSCKIEEKPIFKLVCGRMSNFYVDCKPTTMSSIGSYLVGNIVYDIIKKCNISAIGGLTFGADPIAMAVAHTSYHRQEQVNAFSIRKSKKDHGTGKWIEGPVQPGDKVAIVDDVATTGMSTIMAIERALEQNLYVVKVVILVDREEGGIENIKKYIPDVTSIITKTDLMDYHNNFGLDLS
jgi:orotate phosphoribosyltransferase